MMMNILLLISALIISLNACPDNWERNRKGLCYYVSASNDILNYIDAIAKCESQGGELAMPKNEFENHFLSSMLRNRDITTAWIGIECTGLNPFECIYNDGTYMAYDSYNNFKYAHGIAPVELMVSNNDSLWATQFGHVEQNYMCQIEDNTCPKGFYLSNGIRSCLKIFEKTYDEAAELCASNCGFLSTPASSLENTVVFQTLYFNIKPNSTFVRLGPKYKDGHYIAPYSNQSIFFENFAYQNMNLGDCIAMSVSDLYNNSNHWVNTRCDTPMATLCETPVIAYPCSSRPSPRPIIGDDACIAPYYYENNNATIYSPHYPLPYTGKRCVYVFTVPKGQIVKLQFHTKPGQTFNNFEFYDSLTAQSPFLTLGSDINDQVVVNRQSMMVVMPESSAGSSWSFTFSPVS